MVIRPEDQPHPTLIEIMEKKKRKSIGGGDVVGKKGQQQLQQKEGGKLRSSIRSAGGGVVTTTSQQPLLEGMSSAEVTMIRRLAGNDPTVRKKTMRKLRKWLSTLVLRFPDDLDSRSEVEPNIIRVWKALFYCMWMADKPLPQEQLAEQISNLVPIVGIKPNTLVIFVEWFFRTMSREWNWIDRYRLDKFMMLFRRFLRKTLLTMASRKWSKELVNGFLATIRVHVFNHHPTTSPKLKKGAATSDGPIHNCPLGLQLHFIDIFLEELAKTGADGLKPQKVLKFLSPFIEEMANNSDDRVINAITERIFYHLMRQSDVGMDYQESLMGIDEDDDDEMDDDDNSDSEEDEPENDDTMGEDEVFKVDNGPLDPRAGAVDVILPQLQLDYSILAEKLTEAGGCKLVKKRNRRKLYSLASSFKKLVDGEYPLALPEQEEWKPEISDQEMDKATKRLLELEASESDGKKMRKTKKQRRRDARKLQQHEQLDDTLGSEDSSAFLNDSDFLGRINDNYSGYVNEQMRKSPSAHDDTVNFAEASSNKKTLKKRKNRDKLQNGVAEEQEPKLKKKKYKTVVEFEADDFNNEMEVSVEQSPKTKKHRLSQESDTVINIQLPKKRKSLTLGSGKVLKSKGDDPIKRKNKSLTPTNTSLGWALSGQTVPFNGSPTPYLPSTPIKQNELLRRKLKLGGTPGSEGSKRRINFVLNNNLEHEATDYMPSISKSPAIPFDATKTPTSGILKTKTPTSGIFKIKSRLGSSAGSTPPGRKSLGAKTSPRKKALDFF